jgi:Tol biopolymer transport system component
VSLDSSDCGRREATPVRAGSFPSGIRQVFTDGRWVAYRSTESGRSEIYVTPFPGPGDKVFVSTKGGNMPRWRRDGREIFYLSLDSTQLMAAGVDGRAANFQVTSDQMLFDVLVQKGNWPSNVSADGQRFLVNSLIAQMSTTPLTVVANWQDASKK